MSARKSLSSSIVLPLLLACSVVGCAEADNDRTLCEIEAAPNPALCNGGFRGSDGGSGEGGLHVDADFAFDAGGDVHATSALTDGGDAGASTFDTGATSADVGVTICTGTPTTCASAAEICSSVVGCTASEACGGLATGCDLISDPSSCSLQLGCSWDTTDGFCAGVAATCASMLATSCTEQLGCSITSTCVGAPTPCASLPLSLCSSQPGCSLL